LADSGKPLIVTSGIPLHATEDDNIDPATKFMNRVSEETAMLFTSCGVQVSVVRLPQVHDQEKQGLITWLIDIAREKGVSTFVGDGLNSWPAVHISDAARLYHLVLENGVNGGRYHAVEEEGVAQRDIADAIGRRLNLPVAAISAEEAVNQFGWLANFVGMDMRTSSTKTQERLGWHPTGPGLIADIDRTSDI
jgi:nucleoside-diphosphate-sugar epimerase